jgi:CBS domain-containing protein
VTRGARLGTGLAATSGMNKDLKVSDIMTTALVVVKASDLVAVALAEMHAAGVRHLPVLDEQGRLVGILSNRDLLRQDPTVHVGDVMTRDLKTIAANAPARVAAALLLEHQIGSLPVLGAGGMIVGLVTETDFLRLVYEQLGG